MMRCIQANGPVFVVENQNKYSRALIFFDMAILCMNFISSFQGFHIFTKLSIKLVGG
jgi:hypothetical protein